MLDEFITSYFNKKEHSLFDILATSSESNRTREFVNLINNSDFPEENIPSNAPENYGITTSQLLIVCAVLGCGPYALVDMSLMQKTIKEKEVQTKLEEEKILTIKFPILAEKWFSTEDTIVIKLDTATIRAIVQTVKRINRANNYFNAIAGTVSKPEITVSDNILDNLFPSFFNMGATPGLGNIKPLNNELRVVTLGVLTSKTLTPDAPVLAFGDKFVAQCQIDEKGNLNNNQCYGDYYSLLKVSGTYSFVVL